jgi:hypothetical protein
VIYLIKKTTLGLASAALILTGLTGCIGEKEEYAKGIALYDKGDYKSLLAAKKFFVEYAKKHPDDNDVEDWITKVDKALVEKAADLTDEAMDKKDFEKALEYATIVMKSDPDDKEIQKGYNLVKKSYNEQKKYDKFATYLEERYIETYEIVKQWDLAVKSVETGTKPLSYLVSVSKTLYPKVIELRERVNAESFSITGEDQYIFREVNSDLFEYIVSLERELSQTMNFKEAESIKDYKDITHNLSSETLYSTFLNIQDEMTNYLVEQDLKTGKRKRNIKNTLNFTAAYEKYEQKKAEEAAKQQQIQQQIQQQQSTTPLQKPTTTTTPKTTTPKTNTP